MLAEHDQGVEPTVGGLADVIIFMLDYYKLSGLNALVSIVVNLINVMGMMSYLAPAMTLPGIAAFILTIGLDVDSNVLVVARIR